MEFFEGLEKEIDDGGLRFSERCYSTSEELQFGDSVNCNVVEEAKSVGHGGCNGSGIGLNGIYSSDGSGENEIGRMVRELIDKPGEDNYLEEVRPDKHNSEWINHLKGKDLTKVSVSDLHNILFKSVDEAEEFYAYYSFVVGFSWKRGRSERKTLNGDEILWRRCWLCSKERMYRGERNGTKKGSTCDDITCDDADNDTFQVFGKKKRKGIKRGQKYSGTDCKAHLNIKYDKGSGKYVVLSFEPAHNHGLAEVHERHVLRSNRYVDRQDIEEVKALLSANVSISGAFDFMVREMGGSAFVGFSQKDLYNALQREKRRTAVLGDAETAINWLRMKGAEEEHFFSRFCRDEERRLARLFWRDHVSLVDYRNFGDVLVLDSTYKTNVYGMPLLVFVGANNHRASVVFGCALLADEREESFCWAIQTFLQSMEGVDMPKSVVTDGDERLINAVEIHIPEARHRLCSWHIGRNVTQNVKNADVQKLLGKMIFASYTVHEWEDAWNTMVAKYNLEDNSWISSLYGRRKKWAEAHMRGIFFGGMCSTQRCESMNRVVKLSVGKYTTLTDYVPRLYHGLSRLRDRVILDNYKSRDHARDYRTQFKSMEEQVFNIFTDDVYLVIRGQMKFESSFIFSHRVDLDDSCSHSYITQYEKEGRCWIVSSIRDSTDSDSTYSCSCKLFESDGIACSHIFCVLKKQKVTDYPKSLICKRWTKSVGTNTSVHTACTGNRDGSESCRFLTLMSIAKKACANLAKSDEGYEKGLWDLNKLTEESLKFRAVKKRRLNTGCSDNVVLNPVKARTKGMHGHTVEGGNKGGTFKGNCCGHCQTPGHNKRTCPMLHPELQNGNRKLTMSGSKSANNGQQGNNEVDECFIPSGTGEQPTGNLGYPSSSDLLPDMSVGDSFATERNMFINQGYDAIVDMSSQV
ncbi:protein FAR1-RELATED SEQUENCE 5-like [Argentina anserina]|uniref:protein FAR1-RELATED SEQUENCE 5-like n=1 Tax=Argentina anserina TaxID=57926 RepID=UPI0021768BEB|nr:protein FAR1-RELATED SEQUENCE 5-like [Potentilla anserina]